MNRLAGPIFSNTGTHRALVLCENVKEKISAVLNEQSIYIIFIEAPVQALTSMSES